MSVHVSSCAATLLLMYAELTYSGLGTDVGKTLKIQKL